MKKRLPDNAATLLMLALLTACGGAVHSSNGGSASTVSSAATNAGGEQGQTDRSGTSTVTTSGGEANAANAGAPANSQPASPVAVTTVISCSVTPTGDNTPAIQACAATALSDHATTIQLHNAGTPGAINIATPLTLTAAGKSLAVTADSTVTQIIGRSGAYIDFPDRPNLVKLAIPFDGINGNAGVQVDLAKYMAPSALPDGTPLNGPLVHGGTWSPAGYQNHANDFSGDRAKASNFVKYAGLTNYASTSGNSGTVFRVKGDYTGTNGAAGATDVYEKWSWDGSYVTLLQDNSGNKMYPAADSFGNPLHYFYQSPHLGLMSDRLMNTSQVNFQYFDNSCTMATSLSQMMESTGQTFPHANNGVPCPATGSATPFCIQTNGYVAGTGWHAGGLVLGHAVLDLGGELGQQHVVVEQVLIETASYQDTSLPLPASGPFEVFALSDRYGWVQWGSYDSTGRASIEWFINSTTAPKTDPNGQAVSNVGPMKSTPGSDCH